MGSYFLSCNNSILQHPYPLGISPLANFRVPMQPNFPGSHRKEEMGISSQRKLHLQVWTDGLSLTVVPWKTPEIFQPYALKVFITISFSSEPLSFFNLCAQKSSSKCTCSSLCRRCRVPTANDRDEGKSPCRFFRLIQAGSGFCSPECKMPPCPFPFKTAAERLFIPSTTWTCLSPILERKLTTTMPDSQSNKPDPASHAPLPLLQPLSIIPRSHHSQGLCLTPSPLIPGHILGLKPHVVRAGHTILRRDGQHSLPIKNKPELQSASTTLGAQALN